MPIKVDASFENSGLLPEATEKQVYHFTAEVKDVEIRKVEDVDASFENSGLLPEQNGNRLARLYVKESIEERRTQTWE